MSATAPIRLAIIGAGIMGERMIRAALDHAPEIATVASVWDAAPAALDRITATAPVPRAASAAAAIDAADCVYIATPPATHLDYATQAFAAGRAVFLEKPLATDVPAATAFVRRFMNERAAVNFPFASSFAVERLRSWVPENAAGPAFTRLDIDVAFAAWPRPWQQAAARWLDSPSEGGFTREVVSHFLFLARRMLGQLTLESATVERAPGGTERKIVARLGAGGVPVRLTGAVGITTADDQNTWTLHGVGAMRLRDWSIAERERPDGTWAADPDAQPNESMRPLVLRRQLEGVAQMTHGRWHSLATLEEALDVQAVVEAILLGKSEFAEAAEQDEPEPRSDTWTSADDPNPPSGNEAGSALSGTDAGPSWFTRVIGMFGGGGGMHDTAAPSLASDAAAPSSSDLSSSDSSSFSDSSSSDSSSSDSSSHD